MAVVSKRSAQPREHSMVAIGNYQKIEARQNLMYREPFAEKIAESRESVGSSSDVVLSAAAEKKKQ